MDDIYNQKREMEIMCISNTTGNSKYKNTLIRMYLIENLGECLYNALSFKTSNQEKAHIYKRLCLNEIDTADCISNELVKISCPVPIIRKAVLKVVAVTLFAILSHNMLKILLTQTLKKRMFRIWFNEYHQNNETFWQSMLAHEDLQYQLLNLETKE